MKKYTNKDKCGERGVMIGAVNTTKRSRSHGAIGSSLHRSRNCGAVGSSLRVLLAVLLIFTFAFSSIYASEPETPPTTPEGIQDGQSGSSGSGQSSGEQSGGDQSGSSQSSSESSSSSQSSNGQSSSSSSSSESTGRSTADIQGDLKNAQSQTEQAKQEYEQAKAEEKALEQQIKNLEASIRATEAELATLEGQIADNMIEIGIMKAEIAEMELNVSDQNDGLAARLRLMYMSGDQGIVEVLLGSTSFVDFLENLDMVRRIHEYDVQVLQDLENQLRLLEEKKQELDNIESSLESARQAQIEKKSKLDADKAALAEAKKRAHEITQEKYEVYEDNAAAAAALENELRQRSYSGVYTGGIMSWPVNGPVTSEFGYRIHPIYKTQLYHSGIDIGVPTGTPVRAASSGTVISSGWNSNGYGNLVMIDHGGGVVTCYAHNSRLTVGAGQTVAQGQVIAYAGSTGNSTGPHCHFEVRVMGVAQNPRVWL